MNMQFRLDQIIGSKCVIDLMSRFTH